MRNEEVGLFNAPPSIEGRTAGASCMCRPSVHVEIATARGLAQAQRTGVDAPASRCGQEGWQARVVRCSGASGRTAHPCAGFADGPPQHGRKTWTCGARTLMERKRRDPGRGWVLVSWPARSWESMRAREPGRCGGARLGPSRSCARRGWRTWDAGSEIEGKCELVG
jgi:hypothetical protein